MVKYKNIIENINNIFAWADSSTFSIENESSVKYLSDICVIEITFLLEREIFLLSHDFEVFFNKFILEIISLQNLNAYIIYTENEINPQNRLRKYKGIIPKKNSILKQNFIEHEIKKGDDNSIIVGVVKVIDESNLIDCSNNSNVFIIQSEDKYFFSKEFIQDIVNNIMHYSQLSVVNYIKLCELVVHEHCSFFYRIGGDGSTEVSIQIFCNNRQSDYIVNSIEPLLGRSA